MKLATLGSSRFDLQGALYSLKEGGSLEEALKSLHAEMKSIGFVPLFSNMTEETDITGLELMLFSVMAGIRFATYVDAEDNGRGMSVHYYMNDVRIGCLLTNGQHILKIYQVETIQTPVEVN